MDGQTFKSGMSIIDGILPEKAQIAILGDWGTGTGDAEDVLRVALEDNPDMIIHVGDIYYSGTPDECADNFLEVIRNRVGYKKPVYTLAGNHDYCAAGLGYFWLLDTLMPPPNPARQQASFFCLRNKHWQLLAMDTGYNDAVPGIGFHHATSLRSDEIKWHLDKLNNNAGRSTVLFSHHQLFSPFEEIGQVTGSDSVNDQLAKTFSSFFGEIRAWFWGHEHDFVDGQSGYLGLPVGFCVGHGAIPVAMAGHKRLSNSQGRYKGLANPQGKLGNNGSDFNHGFSILKVDLKMAEVFHFEVNAGARRLLRTTTL
jgi:3',5'-cyclic AMP phosphodiesterase CpdA